MFKNGGAVTFHFRGDSVGVEKEIKSIQSKISTMGKAMTGLGTIMTASLTAPLVLAGKKATEMAGDLEQSIGGAEAVFKDYYDEIVAKAEESTAVMGTSTNQYLEYANKIGSLMQGSGLKTSQAYDLTTKAMQRASDVASIMGIDVESAMEAITGAAKGNFTMMDNLGVAMNATNLEAYALSKGITKSYNAMTQAEKVQLAYNMFLEQTTDYAGNYAKENDTLNGSITTLKAEISNLSAELGKMLIPLVMKVVQKVQQAVNWWKNLDSGTKGIIVTIAKVVAVAGPILLVLGQIVSLVSTLMPLIAAITSPIGLIITAITLVIAGLVLLYKKCEWFRNGVNKVFGFIADFIKLNFAIIKAVVVVVVNHFKKEFNRWKTIINNIKNAISSFVNKVKTFFTNMKNNVKTIFNNIINTIKSLPGKIASVPGKVIDKFKEGFSNIKDVGKNLIKGLWNGLKDMKDWVINKIKGLGKSILKGMKKVLGIKSPSKEFAIIGKFSMLGYTEGLEKMQPEVDSAIKGMFNLSPSMTGTMNNRLSPNVNVTNNVSVETDPLGQMVSKIKTFSGGAKNDYNYGYGG